MTLTKKSAEELAAEVSDKQAGVYAKVGSHTTNGVKRHVVHVTHAPEAEDRRPAYTIS